MDARAAKNPQKCLLCSIKNAFCASPLFIKNVVLLLPSSCETVARSRSGDHLEKQGFFFGHETEYEMRVNDCFFSLWNHIYRLGVHFLKKEKKKPHTMSPCYCHLNLVQICDVPCRV